MYKKTASKHSLACCLFSYLIFNNLRLVHLNKMPDLHKSHLPIQRNDNGYLLSYQYCRILQWSGLWTLFDLWKQSKMNYGRTM